MAKYLERYLKGECAAVWAELTALGAAVRREPLLTDALGVARETMLRVGRNVELLERRLREIGYVFGELSDGEVGGSVGALREIAVRTPPDGREARRMRAVERAAGAIPVSLTAWYVAVGGVNFVGHHREWDGGEFLDPLFVYRLDDDLVAWVCDRFENGRKRDVDGEEDEEPGILISPDDYHKANVSGGLDYLVAPAAAMDARLLNERHRVTFVEYLRLAMSWGGFPGFDDWPASRVPREHLAYLTNRLEVI